MPNDVDCGFNVDMPFGGTTQGWELM